MSRTLVAALLALAGCNCKTPPPYVSAGDYAKQLGLHVTGVDCAETDSDLDGYVTCTINDDGRLTSIQCASQGSCTTGGCKITQPNVLTDR